MKSVVISLFVLLSATCYSQQTLSDSSIVNQRFVIKKLPNSKRFIKSVKIQSDTLRPSDIKLEDSIKKD